MKNINIDKEMKLFLEAACGVGQNPEDTGCTPASASKPKSKPKIKVPKIKIPKIKMPKIKIKAPTISPEKLEKRRKEKEKARNRPDRKPNMVDGVDVIRDKEDEQHFIDDFFEKADKGVDKEEYDGKMQDQWEEQQKKRTPAERKQIKKDVASWKQLGGFEAQEQAVADGTATREEIRERNERISEISHTTITKVDRPIERGISVPNDVAEQILADFEEGEMVEIPDESGHGSSGFSTSAETARGFADVDDDNPEQTSIVFRIEPNSNGEVRGAFIDGEGEDFQGEGEITRSSKSKAKVRKVERVRLPNGKMVVTVILTEPDDLSEMVVREEKDKVNMVSRKYLEGPINPKPQGKVKDKKELEECIAVASMFGDDMVIGKNRDRNYRPNLKVVRELTGYGVELCYVVDQDTDWSEGMNSRGIGIVNSALFVKRDEKDFDKAKKKKAMSKDGARIREALRKTNIRDVVKSLVTFHGGIKGHTIVGDGKKLVVIENTSRVKPVVKIKDLTKEPIVRTNHGIEHPEQGYQNGNDKLSSELRLMNALNVVHQTPHYKELFPAFYNHKQDRGPKYDLVRAQNKLWTSSQVLMNLNRKEILLYLIPGAVKFVGIENRLPNDYDSQISFVVKEYEQTPDEKYRQFVPTTKKPKYSALVSEIVNPILKEYKLPLLKEETKIKKVVGIYGGRYQPFGPHHYKTYKWLKSKVDDAYITTSNIKKPPRHPMNFKEKVRHMVKMGVPKNRIVKEPTPLVAKNVLKKYDPETTAVIYIFGEKDAGRLKGGKKKDGSPSYFQDYKKNKKNIKGFEEHGYYLVAPHVSVKVGGKEVSGTVMRDLLGSPKINDEERPKLFKQAFGYFDKGVYNMMTNKFRKLYEVYEEFIINKDILKIIKESSGIAQSIPQMSDEGMYDFFETFDDYKRITPLWAEQHGWELVNYILGQGAVDPEFDLDMEHRGEGGKVGTVTYGRTINQHRKNTASVDNPFPKYERRQGIINKALGWEIVKFMYKDDDKVKIKQTKPAINQTTVKRAIKKKDLSNLNKVNESKILNEGNLIAARNKGHLKNKGKTALDINAMKSKFKGRGDISDAFVFAMEDLEKAISSLSEKQRNKIFMNGKAFMNLEVMWPKSANVIDYDKAEIVFHGALEYDDDGNVVGEVKGSARMLAGMIKQVNQNVQKKYNIGKPNFLTVPKTQNFGTKKRAYLSRLNKLQKEYGLKDNDTLGKYHQSYWEEFIYNAAKQFGFTIPATKLKKLTKRWAFFDKSYKIPMIRKDFNKQPEFLDWVLTTDKQDHARMVKENMKPFEILFFDVGAEVMKNVSGWLAASPDAAVQGIKRKLDAAIKDVRSKKDLKKLNRLKIQLDRLNAIGGLEAVVPSEGLVFKYKGKTYKFTGAFAPINQITGLMTF